MAYARVHLDQSRCVTSGQCVLTAPEVFDQRHKDGVGVVLVESPGPDLVGVVEEAVAGCPAAAIRLSYRQTPAGAGGRTPIEGP
ncbi:ferredoxin [Kutzneria chonburiensis]|uniref:Ferredoxin n=1 Tax=Kutzneria chonburiensis TaxID=1483604 RepID=A0ABV6MN51_9PSEU|nr:ferredoxin [Kutzneria chonburiensis]